jgi:hypothetical protein
VEGELNGMMTYDRRIVRPDIQKWHADIQVSNVSYISLIENGLAGCRALYMLTGLRLYMTLLCSGPMASFKLSLTRIRTVNLM